MFCKYEDVERLVRLYSDSMYCLVYPKIQDRAKSLKCIERVFVRYIDNSPRLRTRKSEQKWLIKALRKESGFNTLANGYTDGKLSALELDNMLTSLRVYYHNDGNKPKKLKSNLIAAIILVIVGIFIAIGVAKGIERYKTDGFSVQQHLNENSEASYSSESSDYIKRIFAYYEN